MKEIVKFISFILVATGFVGLIINEFAIDLGRAVTITFAAINAAGLTTLAFAHWRMK